MPTRTPRAAWTFLTVMTLLAGCAAPRSPVPARDAEVEIGRDVFVKRIGDRAFLVTESRPWPANALLVEMPDSTLVLVNTLYRPEAAGTLLSWTERTFGRRPMVAINTHFHADVLGGNAALLERGVPVYGSDRTVRALAERGERFRSSMLGWLDGDETERETFRRATFVPPDHVFPASAGLVLTFGGQEVRVLFPGPAHSIDNVVVFFPSERLLFAGCLAIEGPGLGNLSDADLEAWPSAISELRGLGAVSVVPGHGMAAGPELLSHTLEVLAGQR